MRRWLAALLCLPFLASGSETARRGPFKVAKVIDGDTVKLGNGETVRLLGVDAPEIVHEKAPAQRFGNESSAYLHKLLEGAEVVLETEAEPLDVHGRTLAYVWKGELLVNAEAIRRGFAWTYAGFAFSRHAEFMELEKKARKARKGIWDLKPMDWQEAEQHPGERLIVEGKIVDSYVSKKACFLHFGEDGEKRLSLVVFASAYDRFPDRPDRLYKGKSIRVAGMVKKHDCRPEIVVEDPGRVEVAE